MFYKLIQRSTLAGTRHEIDAHSFPSMNAEDAKAMADILNKYVSCKGTTIEVVSTTHDMDMRYNILRDNTNIKE